MTGRWVVPGDGPPLPGGTVTVAGDTIAAVEPHGRRRPDHDLGNAALMPGLVNAHTHLDLGGLRGRCPPGPDLTAWLRQVIAHRRQSDPAATVAAIASGIAESLHAGTTLVGDISAGGTSWDALATSPLRAVVYWELLGLSPERAMAAWDGLTAWLATRKPAPRCRPGVSPHAPYSVHRSLLPAAAGLGIPVAVHLAESAAELQLLRQRDGPFAEFLRELGVWEPDGLAASAGEVLRSLHGSAPTAVVHGNYLADALPANATLIYCPRTHAAFGHPPHPFRQYLERGGRVALGTDSLASNPDLSVLAEARFVHARYPEVPGDVLLQMATVNGARALGWDGQTGSLSPGKSADLVVLPLPDADASEPWALIWESEWPVSRVLCGGQWIRSGRAAADPPGPPPAP
jgi:cytosine/adenosine deaminase-related metal-dependent hydrolase